MIDKESKFILSLAFILAMGLILSSVYAQTWWFPSEPDFVINETAHFDAGFKANSSSNYEIETITDNLRISSNTITLSNKYSDRYTFDDADADTWKWDETFYDYGNDVTHLSNISNGQYNTQMSINADEAYADNNMVLRDVMISGDFDVQVDYNDYVLDDSAYWYVGLVFADTPDWSGSVAFGMYRTYDGALGGDIYCAINWADTYTCDTTVDTSGKLRIVRADDIMTYYYWNQSTNDWFILEEKEYAGVRDSVYVYFYTSGYDTGVAVPTYPSVSYDNFKINYGVLTNATTEINQYRQSGSWISDTQTLPNGYKISDIYVNLSTNKTYASGILENSLNSTAGFGYETTGCAFNFSNNMAFVDMDAEVGDSAILTKKVPVDVNTKWNYTVKANVTNLGVIQRFRGILLYDNEYALPNTASYYTANFSIELSQGWISNAMYFSYYNSTGSIMYWRNDTDTWVSSAVLANKITTSQGFEYTYVLESNGTAWRGLLFNDTDEIVTTAWVDWGLTRLGDTNRWFITGEPYTSVWYADFGVTEMTFESFEENKIDSMSIINSTGYPVYVNDTDISTNGIVHYYNSSYWNLINGTDFKINLTLKGLGESTPIVFDIIGEFDEVPVTYTSLYAVELDVPDATITSDQYQTVFSEDFNSTTLEYLGFMSSFNIMKSTGGGTSVVSARVKIDGETYLEEVVRSVPTINQAGSTGLTPLRFLIPEGEHNITLDMKRTGNGNIDIYNIDFILGKFNTTGNALVRGNITNISYSFNTSEWSNGYNFTINKDIISPTYYGGKFTVTSTGTSKIWLNFTNTNTTETSRNAIRQTTADTYGAVGLVWLNENISDSHNITVGTKAFDSQIITVNGTAFNWDMYDSDSNHINNFESYNTSISEETPMIITGSEFQLIDSELIRNRNATGFYISTSVSFNSSSDAQTSEFKINVTNSTCEASYKDRYLSGNSDFGNIFMFVICDTDLIIEQNYTINLYGRAGSDVPTVETTQISSEVLTAFEITNFSLSELGVAPLITIQEPDEIEYSYDGNIWFNVTTNQDNTDTCWFTIDGNTTEYMTNSTGNWNSQNYTTEGQHYVTFYCNNTDGLTGMTDDIYFYNFISSIPNIINIRHNDLYDINYNKTLEINHLLYDTDGTFVGYLNTSYCVVEMTRPDGTEYVNYVLVNNSDGIYNLSMNFTGEPEGQWIAGYTCSYNETLYTGIVEAFNLTSGLYVQSYTEEKITEALDSNYSSTFGYLFIFIGIIFLYMAYTYNKRNTFKRYKRGEEYDN